MVQKQYQNILLVNDDGIGAAGIQLLAKIADHFAENVWIVAPATDKSGVSNSVSLREPVRVEQRDVRQFAVHGTPADCVTIAVKHLMRETPPELLLSGINSGSNIGFETVLSGTVGAAMTGVLLGIPSIALSQDKLQEQPPEWRTAEAFCQPVLQHLLQHELPSECCLNVNFPNLSADKVKGIAVTRQGIGKVKGMQVTPITDPHGENYYWIRVEHGVKDLPELSEVAAVQQGFISVTPLTWERTAREAWETLYKRVNDG